MSTTRHTTREKYTDRERANTSGKVEVNVTEEQWISLEKGLIHFIARFSWHFAILEALTGSLPRIKPIGEGFEASVSTYFGDGGRCYGRGAQVVKRTPERALEALCEKVVTNCAERFQQIPFEDLFTGAAAKQSQKETEERRRAYREEQQREQRRPLSSGSPNDARQERRAS